MTNRQLVAAVVAIGELAKLKLPGAIAVQVYRRKAALLDLYKPLIEAKNHLDSHGASESEIKDLFDSTVFEPLPDPLYIPESALEGVTVSADSIGLLEYLGLVEIKEG